MTATFKEVTVFDTLMEDLDGLGSYLDLHVNKPVNFICHPNHSEVAIYRKRLFTLDDFKDYVECDDRLDRMIRSIVSKLSSLLINHDLKDMTDQFRRTGVTLTPAKIAETYPAIKHDLIYENFSISF